MKKPAEGGLRGGCRHVTRHSNSQAPKLKQITMLKLQMTEHTESFDILVCHLFERWCVMFGACFFSSGASVFITSGSSGFLGRAQRATTSAFLPITNFSRFHVS